MVKVKVGKKTFQGPNAHSKGLSIWTFKFFFFLPDDSKMNAADREIFRTQIADNPAMATNRKKRNLSFLIDF